ncbi:MAG: DUF3160 domain-containing protein [Gemmataceae bacterium]|nr:DUF3160 domain-containing protein [Gemmataceae bacterium]
MNRLLLVAAPCFCLAALAAPPVRPAKVPPPAEADVFGYGAALEKRLAALGELSPDGFAKRHAPKAGYLKELDFDPTKARYFKEFNSAPPAAKRWAFDFKLNADELAAFKKNGFVASERLGAASFAQMLYRVYSRDLPVYLSADMVLHAWHRSYDSMLEELEESYLYATLHQLLDGMAARLPQLQAEAGKGALADGIKDADYFLAVARSLLTGQQAKTALGQDERVEKTLEKCAKLGLEDFSLFGCDRKVDFSQFKVRGHYENSDLLKRYFKAMMWCGRTDLRVAGKGSSPRELAGALVLHDLLRRSGKFGAWEDFDKLLQTFVGRTDSMTFGQLGRMLKAGGIAKAADVKGLGALEMLQKRIMAGKLGAQEIVGDAYIAPLGSEKLELPRSFTVLGQKFTMDSWVLGNTVFDRVVVGKEKVMRRVPSCLDVAFAALGTDATVPALAERMKDKKGRRFRDGLDYQANLSSLREVIDGQDAKAWDENLYTGWLACLRELSKPMAKTAPQATRTEAWAMKNLNTQLASWTQLRHDTILYVKQSYTAGTLCYYPAGLVEPVPAFWERMERMAIRAAELMEKTPFPDLTAEKEVAGFRGKRKVAFSVKSVQARQARFFRNFAKQVAVLKAIAVKQAAQKELATEETAFLRKTVEIEHRGSGGPRYNGWYFGMFYKGHTDADKWDALVADVHTDIPDDNVGDPGCVLHQGVGNVDFLLVAADNGKDRVAYGGPVLSHYEFEMPGVARKSGSEWRKQLREGKAPPRPSWTKGYLVPGTNPEAKGYRHDNDEK